MSAYIVFTRTKTIDQKELEKYRTGIKAAMKDHPIEVLVADGKHEVLEGDPIEGMVIVKFPSVKAAKDWTNSEAYQAIAKHRKLGAPSHGYIVEGLSERRRNPCPMTPSPRPARFRIQQNPDRCVKNKRKEESHDY